MTTSNNIPGYGAVPPQYITSVAAAGQVLTSNGINGTSWMSQNITTPSNALQIGGNPDPVVTFHYDGTITTKAGSITSDEWISVIKVMKQLIMDMSQDEELVSKYPYIRDAAHSWMMNKLKGE
jgi:hypothetical protein